MRRGLRLLVGLLVIATLLITPALSTAATPPRQNTYPIVLVHGLGGWGRSETAGFKYWGGFIDLQEDLKSNGYQTYTAAVGPVSSNWDRAVELYAQIKGGTVDYGLAHATKHGHARYGRTYPGFAPQWGTLNPATGKPNKVHLVGHSQGGQTIRTLAALLGQGSAAEVAATPAAQLSPLFKTSRKSWVSSVTSISTPHDGASPAIGINQFLPMAQQLVGLIAATTGAGSSELYDFKMDQWGLKRQPGESFDSYADRVWNSSIWTRTKDISAWDLTPDGAKELNQWVKAQPDIYYYSWSTEKSYESWVTGYQYPEPAMSPLLSPFSWYAGSYTRNEPGKVVVDSSWWKNDGIANTNAMDGPQLGSTDLIVNPGSTPRVGVWTNMGVLDSVDHIDIIGIGPYYDVRNFYRTLAGQVAALPQ